MHNLLLHPGVVKGKESKESFFWLPTSSQRKGGWGKRCFKLQGGEMKPKVLQN